MRYAVEARTLIDTAAVQLGIEQSLIDDIFRDAPLDFPVIVARHLPFFVDRVGMAGITLFGRVYLLERVAAFSREFIVLLRHEAEHVRQQREGIGFYPRYLSGWLRAFAREIIGRRGPVNTGTAGAWYRAYRQIAAEREAYAAGNRARALLSMRP